MFCFANRTTGFYLDSLHKTAYILFHTSNIFFQRYFNFLTISFWWIYSTTLIKSFWGKENVINNESELANIHHTMKNIHYQGSREVVFITVENTWENTGKNRRFNWLAVGNVLVHGQLAHGGERDGKQSYSYPPNMWQREIEKQRERKRNRTSKRENCRQDTTSKGEKLYPSTSAHQEPLS